MKRNTVMRLTDLDWKIKTMRTPISNGQVDLKI